MPLPDAFKYDQRVRMRYLRKGQLTESELEKHLAALKDVVGNAASVELKQPAFQTEAERAQNTIVVRPAPVRPAAPAPVEKDDLYDEIDDELDDELDDEDEDELKDADEDETTVVQSTKGEAARAVPKPAVAPTEGEEEAPGSGPRGSVAGEKKNEEADDGWG